MIRDLVQLNLSMVTSLLMVAEAVFLRNFFVGHLWLFFGAWERQNECLHFSQGVSSSVSSVLQGPNWQTTFWPVLLDNRGHRNR